MPEATFHLQSLSLAMVFVSSVTLALLAPALLRFAEDFRESMRSWILGAALVTSTDIVFFLGVEVPHAQTLLTVIAGLGAVEWLHSLRLYNGGARRAKWPYAAIALGTGLSLAAPSYPLSVLVTSTLFAVLYLAVAATAARIREPERSVGRLLLVLVFGMIALVMAARVGLVLSGLRSGAPPGFTSPVRALMFLIASSGPVAGSFAFVLTCGERLGARLLHQGLTDSLTGVPNRRAFLDSLARTLSLGRRRGEPVAVLVVDVDHFKRVNDSAGHAAGDQALVAVAELLTGALRAGDTLGRLGGEEFGVVAHGAEPTLAAGVAERLRETIATHPVSVDGQSYDLTVSIGVVVSTRCDEDSLSLLARADGLMYEAKRLGRNQVICETASSSAQVHEAT